MHKVLFSFLIVSVFASTAQTTVFRKIAQRHDIYAASAWKGVDSFRWDYNADAFMTKLSALKQDGSGNWNNLYRYTYTLNSDNRVTAQIRENWTGGNWVNSTRYTNDYDASGNLLLVHYDVWNGGVWNATGKIEYTGYNAKNKVGTETVFSWNAGAWDYLSKDVYQYYPSPKDYQTQTIEKYNWNSNNLLWDSLERLYLTYNNDSVSSKTRSVPFGGSWFLNSKEVITFSTTPFRRTEYLTQTWDTAANPNAWLNDKRILYTYNTFDSLDKTVSDKYTSGAWYSQTRSQYMYNGSQQKTEFYTESYNGSWVNNFRQTFLYTGSNLTEEKQYSGQGTTWFESKRLNYTFDMNNLMTFRQVDTFNGAVFVPNNRDFYYYNAYTVNINDIIATIQRVLIYPNPANETMMLELTSGKPLQLSIRVIDLSGKCRLMITQPVFAGHNTIPIPLSSLTVGNYLLQLVDVENGHQEVRHISVNN